MVQIYYSNVNNRSKNNDFLPNSTSQIRYFFYKCLLRSFPSDFVPRSMAATVLHDMVLNCDVQGLKAPDTNWWMVLGLARLWGKTGFWQVFFGPKPIGSNQKRGSDLGKKEWNAWSFEVWSWWVWNSAVDFLLFFCSWGAQTKKRVVMDFGKATIKDLQKEGVDVKAGGSFCLMSSSTLIGLW